MIGAPGRKAIPAEQERTPTVMPAPSGKSKPVIATQPPAEITPEPVDIKTNDVYILPSQHRTAQNIAIRAGLPTFVNTYYNPTNRIRDVGWGTAVTSGLIGGVIGMGAEVYDEWSAEDELNYIRIAQTGALLGTATMSGVVVGQAVQKSLLTNSYMLWGASSGATSSQIVSGFMGDALGSGAAAIVFASGAYMMGWADPADARTAMAKGATGAVIMAAGKTAGTQVLFSLAGTSGSVAALGPYAITYLAAVGAVYLTDWIFKGMDKREESDRIASVISGMQK